MKKSYVLVVDDEPDIRQLLQEILEDEGYQVAVAQDGESARNAIRDQQPDLVLLDVWMPDIDGITLYKQLLADGNSAPVIVMSGHGTVETAVEATRLGAYTFLEKPLSIGRLLPAIEGALAASQRHIPGQTKGLQRRQSNTAIVGKSLLMQRLREQLGRVAKYSLPVMIEGEAGTGKALCARYLHSHGLHRDGPFVECQLAALPIQAMANVLFGKEQEDTVTPGKLEQANNGTLYIAGIEQLPLEYQDRLIGYLKSGEFLRQGGKQFIKASCRLICTSNFDLTSLVNQGRFRDDLYHLLKGVAIHTPTLKEHSEDVPELLNSFVDSFVEREKLPYRHFGLPAQNRLRNYYWPGNVKELNNIVRQLLITGNHSEVQLEELDGLLSKSPQQSHNEITENMSGLFELPLREAREAFERSYFEYHMAQQDGSVGKVAKVSGVERSHLYRKLNSLGIEYKTGK